MTNLDYQYLHGFGLRVLPREQFLTDTFDYNPFDNAADNASELVLLRDRAAKYEGQFVVYDPSDGEEGWLLVGDDFAGLCAETADRFRDMEEI